MFRKVLFLMTGIVLSVNVFVQAATITVSDTQVWGGFGDGGVAAGDTLQILAGGNLTLVGRDAIDNGMHLIVEEGGVFTADARLDMDSNGKITMNGGEFYSNVDFKFPDSSGNQNVEIWLNGGIMVASYIESRTDRGSTLYVGGGVLRIGRTSEDRSDPENTSAWTILPILPEYAKIHIVDIGGDWKEVSASLYGQASNPDPLDGLLTPPDGDNGAGYWIMLQFTPGEGATTHTAYFSSSFDDVNDRSAAVSLGSPPFPLAPPPLDITYYVGMDDSNLPAFAQTPLERGVTYYWAVDETNDVTGTTVEGEIWSFVIGEEKAHTPTPAHDAQNVYTSSVDLGWLMGSVDDAIYTVSYDVYWGTVEADVIAGTSEMANVSVPTMTIGPLSGETDYYWKVDTRLAKVGDPDIVVPGDVWHFTTLLSVPEVDPHLIGWWKLDGGFDDLVFDSSGHENHGTRRSAPGNNDLPEDVPGTKDGAFEFDGTDYVDFPIANGGLGSSDLVGSVAFWFKTTNPDDVMMWYASDENDGNGGGGDDEMHIDIAQTNDDGELGFFVEGGGNGDVGLLGPRVDDGEWHHVAGTWNQAGQLRLYVEGALYAAADSPAGGWEPFDFDEIHRLGRPGDPVRYFEGLLDDVRLYDIELSAKDIQILAGRLNAANPDPAIGATGVSRTPTLSWLPGAYVAATNGNILYYGADAGAVAARTATSVTLTNPSYALPLTLDLGQTFYWAVDTVNGAETWPGDIWSFEVTNWLEVDSMETYTPWTMPGNNIFEAYRDGMGNCDPGNGNDTGANLTENMDAAFVFTGLQSMMYDFDNDGMVYNPCTMAQGPRTHLYSKIVAQVAGLPSGIGTNWTIQGVKALSLRFYGQATNSVEPMWVQLNGGAKVTYGDYDDEDPADITEEEWHEWFIDLADFGVALNNVTTFAIGFGTEGSATPGGSGKVYFDDFRLYTPVCRPARHTETQAKLDFAPLGAPDCVVDYEEIDVLADNWLEQDAIVTPQTPEAGKLLVHWAFNETSGLIAGDSSVNGRTGQVNNLVGESWVNDPERGRCFDFSDGDNIVDNDANLYMNGLDEFTVAVWIKSREINTDAGFIIFEEPEGQDKRNIRYDSDGGEGDLNVIKYGVTTGDDNREEDESSRDAQTTDWQHIAVTWQSRVGQKLYINGALDTPTEDDGHFTGTTSGYDILMVGQGGKFGSDAAGWNGLIDDVRIYSYALSQNEVVSAMGETSDLYIPLSVPGEIHESEGQGDRVINFKDYAELVD
ncbi:MAG: LamG domain-containing protein, partial [Planctomycetota bacterium]